MQCLLYWYWDCTQKSRIELELVRDPGNSGELSSDNCNSTLWYYWMITQGLFTFTSSRMWRHIELCWTRSDSVDFDSPYISPTVGLGCWSKINLLGNTWIAILCKWKASFWCFKSLRGNGSGQWYSKNYPALRSFFLQLFFCIYSFIISLRYESFLLKSCLLSIPPLFSLKWPKR